MGTIDELRKEQDELLRDKNQLQELLDSPGWEMVRRFLQANIIARRQLEFNNPVESIDAAFRSAGQKGEIAGIQESVRTPTSLIAGLQMELDNTATAIEEEQENDRDD